MFTVAQAPGVGPVASAEDFSASEPFPFRRCVSLLGWPGTGQVGGRGEGPRSLTTEPLLSAAALVLGDLQLFVVITIGSAKCDVNH
jgi:hypothetical protein